MTDSQLSLFAGALLSLAFAYVPKLREWFDAKDATTKRLIMAGSLVIISLAIFGGACGNVLGYLPIQITITCDRGGAVNLATYFILSLIANQATFLISPERKPVTVEGALNAPK